MLRTSRINPFSAGKRACIPLSLLPSCWCHLAVILLCLSGSLSSFATEPITVTTPHFSFSFHSRDERVVGNLIEKAEEMRAEIVRDLGVELDDITRVYFAPSLKAFQTLQPGGEIQTGPLRKKQETLFADLDLDQVAISRRTFDVAGHYARPDIFSLGVDATSQEPLELKQ